MSRLHVVLVPGFFGFVNFGELVYFQHVAAFLEERLETLGYAATVTSARVPPTASLRTRSAALAAHIATVSEKEDRVAIIGHSSGGLDARLVVAPGINLEVDFDLEPISRRVESVVSVASPHRGTPLAELFVGLLGRKALKLLSLVTVELLRGASIPIGVLAKIGATLARLRLPGSKTEALLDHLHEELIGQLPADQRDKVREFLEQVGDDQSLVSQITPAAADLFDASASRRDTVRYGCVVVAAPQPSMRTQLSLPRQPVVWAGYLLYRWLHGAAASDQMRAPALDAESRAALRAGLGKVPDFSASDAIVPTLSQIHGDVLWAGPGDHLDIIGHFHGPRLTPRHYDWLMTGAHFDGAAFEAAWSAVTQFISQPPSTSE